MRFCTQLTMAMDERKLAESIKNRITRPMQFREIMRALRLGPQDRRMLKRILADLVVRGEIIKTRGNRYGLPEKMDLETGVFQAHPEGYGFVISEQRGKGDIFIAARGRLDAMDGDRVIVRVAPPLLRKRGIGQKREGVIVRILERAHSRIVGTYEVPEHASSGYGFVVSSNPRIAQDLIIPPGREGGAKPGDLVSAEIIAYPLRGRPAEGRIVKVIGRPGDPGIEPELIIEEYELPVHFSNAALEEASKILQEVTPSMRRMRRDLRQLTTVTIDGEKARDFDDAISIEKTRHGYRLWVHIADVAAYVKEGTYLDQEAYLRGTSVYFPDRVIPMLPPELSNGICSLNPGVDRLAMTIEMDIARSGDVIGYDIYDSIISSDARLTYTEVREILVDKDQGKRTRYAGLMNAIETMDELMEILRTKRLKRGSLDFDLPEPEIILDLQGRMTDIVRAERNRAHQIIEEFMIAANETVAGHMERTGAPFLYRVHDEPDDDKIADLSEFLSTIGITMSLQKKIRPANLQNALAKAKGTSLEALVNTVLLRTMKQARYSVENIGHFGLASSSYTHFTSPIRRYPDLIVHRILKATAKGRFADPAYRERVAELLADAAEHCSRRERTAMEAERDVVTMLKLEFMRDKLGESYDGVITGVVPFGFFVQLVDYFVEGLVHVSTLSDDYYHYIENRHCLMGERRKRIFRIGDRVRVNVDRVDRERKRIDFSLAKD